MSKEAVDFGKKYPYEYLGVDSKPSGNGQRVTDCHNCGKPGHLYINIETGQYECKVCNHSGNIYTYLRYFYKELPQNDESKLVAQKLDQLSENRGLKKETFEKFGFRFYGDKSEWLIPVRNLSGEIVNLRIYHPGTAKTKGKGRALTGVPLSLGGLETYNQETEIIWLCEGEWDAMALYEMMTTGEALKGNSVFWLPGAGVFKESWLDVFKDKKIVLVFDKDKAGFNGRKKAATLLQESGIKEADIMMVDWELLKNRPDGFDLRDFYLEGSNIEDLGKLIVNVPKEAFENRQENINEILEKFPHISERKVSWADVISVFDRHYRMSRNLTMGLKMIAANVHSLNIKDTTPNWQHIISPAGSAKTEWISAFGSCSHVHIMSNASAKSLVSGYAARKGGDPSLIPKLIGKCLMIKDFTEILQMHRGDQEEMMGVLRGAYDGYLVKTFGNGVIRKYEDCQFNIVSACTKAIYGDNKAAMGERFLKYAMIEGNSFEGIDDVLTKAVEQTGREKSIRDEVQGIIKEFCEIKFDYTELPELAPEDKQMLIGLARLVAYLRTEVSVIDGTKDVLAYRPQIEYGTRPIKVMALNLRCLGMVNGKENDFQVTEEDREIVVRNAVASMTPFSFEIARALYKAKEEGLTDKELRTVTNLIGRDSTCTHYRSNLETTGFVESYLGEKPDPSQRGPAPRLYRLSDEALKIWKQSRIEDYLSAPILKASDTPPQKNRMKPGAFRFKKPKD